MSLSCSRLWPDVRERLATRVSASVTSSVGRAVAAAPEADFSSVAAEDQDARYCSADRAEIRRTMQPIDLPGDPPANLLDDRRCGCGGVVRCRSVTVERSVNNHDRNIGTRLAGIIVRKFGDAGLPDHTAVTLKLMGSAGQSLGAFLVPGIRILLDGEANDGVGKSLCGGDIIIRPPRNSGYNDWWNHPIIGNTALYGATAGRLFAAGRSGERFAVRNSGATAVVEGVGDHACTFMTRGVVVSIGDALGWNFGSGMTGGWACLYDPAIGRPGDPFRRRADATDRDRGDRYGVGTDRGHLRFTSSPIARAILEAWEDSLRRFWVVRRYKLGS